MALVNTTTTTNKTVASGTTAVAQAQGSVASPTPKTTSGIKSAINTVSGVIKKGEHAVESYLSDAFSSASSIFSSSEKALASGIDSLFGSSFSNTANPTTTTVQTKIPDPVDTMLSKSKPTASMFKTSSTSPTPTAVTGLGTSSESSGLSSLLGTKVQLISDRFKVTSVSDLSDKLLGSDQTASIGGVYKDLFSVGTKATSSLNTALSTAQGAKNSIVGTITGIRQSVTNVVTSGENVYASAIDQYRSTVSSVSSLFSPAELSSLFNIGMSGTTGTSLIASETGYVTNATCAGVSGDTVTALSQLGAAVGCDTALTYTPTSLISSQYATALAAASKLGLSDIFAKLIGCDMASTESGQAALTYVARNTATTDVTTSTSAAAKLKNPSSLNREWVDDLLKNNNLTASDVPAVSNAATSVGTTIKKQYQSDVSTATEDVADLSLMSQSPTPFLDAAMSSDLYSDALNSSELTASYSV